MWQKETKFFLFFHVRHHWGKGWSNTSTTIHLETGSQMVWPHIQLPPDSIPQKKDNIPQKTFTPISLVNRRRGHLRKRGMEELTEILNVPLYEANFQALSRCRFVQHWMVCKKGEKTRQDIQFSHLNVRIYSILKWIYISKAFKFFFSKRIILFSDVIICDIEMFSC